MRFAYEEYVVDAIGSNRRTIVFRPTIPLRIIGLRVPSRLWLSSIPVPTIRSYPCTCCTGSESSRRPVRRRKSVPSGGGSVDVGFVDLNLELKKGRSIIRWAATVGSYPGTRAILGNSGCLEFVLASFNHHQRYVTLQPNRALPPPMEFGS